MRLILVVNLLQTSKSMKRLVADNGKVNERSEKLTERQSYTSQSHAISMKNACPTFLLMLERL